MSGSTPADGPCLKILLVSPFTPARDGVATYSAGLAGELARQGQSVGVISTGAAGGPDEVVGLLPGLPDRDGRRRLAARVRGHYDVAHVQFAVATYGTRVPDLVALVRALRTTGMPIVITMHEVTRDTELLHAVGRWGYRRLAALADQIIVHTTQAKRVLTDRLRVGTPVQVIRHFTAPAPAPAVDEGALRTRFGLDESRVLLAFGFLTPDKGLDVLVEALALLAARRPLDGVKLVVAGSVRERSGLFRLFELRDRRHLSQVRRRARETGVDAMMTFSGYVPTEEMATWFTLADAAVLPYRRIEDSGVAAMAAAAGTPLIVSDAGELHLVYESVSFAAGDPTALADALEAFLWQPPAPRSATCAAARTSLPAIVEQTTAVYRGLVRV